MSTERQKYRPTRDDDETGDVEGSILDWLGRRTSTKREKIAEAVENGPASSLHAKLAEVAESLQRLEERGKNQEQGYKFVTESDIFEAVRPALAKRGVTIVQYHREILSIEDHETRRGGTMRTVTILFEFQITDSASGERETYPFLGVGADTGDKWYTKASTSAEKFFIRRLFLISAGGDEDPDGSSYERESKRGSGQTSDRPPKVVSDAQVNRLWAIARQNVEDREVVRRLVWYRTRGRTARSADLYASGKPSEYDDVVAYIQNYSKYQEQYESNLSAFEKENPIPAAEETPAPPEESTESDLPKEEETPSDPDPSTDDIPF